MIHGLRTLSKLLLLSMLCVAAATATAPAADGRAPAEATHFDLTRPDIRAYVDALVNEQGMDRAQLTALLEAAVPQPQIIESISKPAEKTLQWWQYRARMLTPARIEAGVALWREHRELLDRIAIKYAVAPEYLVALLGVETAYGRSTGRYRVLDALCTLAFDYPPRADYFRKELAEWLLLVREQGLDALTLRGSYAGAMGALQFMPSSYRKYAVSESRAPRLDLWTNWADIFASTANYLHQFGWQYGAPVLAEAQPPPDPIPTPPDRATLTETIAGLRTRGFTIDTSLPPDTPAALLGAPLQDAMSYRVGFQNFYVITRYNGSTLYAMAVHDLAETLKARILEDGAS
jgi:membrane-bound lytic murein transglycosylase B